MALPGAMPPPSAAPPQSRPTLLGDAGKALSFLGKSMTDIFTAETPAQKEARLRQQRALAEVQTAQAELKAERRDSQRLVLALAEEERQRRLSVNAQMEQDEMAERRSNQQAANAAMEIERERRLSEGPDSPTAHAEDVMVRRARQRAAVRHGRFSPQVVSPRGAHARCPRACAGRGDGGRAPAAPERGGRGRAGCEAAPARLHLAGHAYAGMGRPCSPSTTISPDPTQLSAFFPVR